MVCFVLFRFEDCISQERALSPQTSSEVTTLRPRQCMYTLLLGSSEDCLPAIAGIWLLLAVFL